MTTQKQRLDQSEGKKERTRKRSMSVVWSVDRLLETEYNWGGARNCCKKMTSKNVLPEQGSEMTKRTLRTHGQYAGRRRVFFWFMKRDNKKRLVFYIRDEDVKLPMPAVTP